MSQLTDFNLTPDIVLSRDEHRQLFVLAVAGTHPEDDAEWLLHELERAMIVADEAIPKNVVRMGSLVRYRNSGGDERTIRLVFPGEADISLGRISVMTPVGVALLGLREGQSISYRTRDGRRQALTVVQVRNRPGGDGPGPLAA
ncbi:MAG: nucleoside diphosphate kinase regulator [Bauldia sp.]|nr:nucleoside diphosphate kinase regulator [Bauldia sp.]MCW5718792.1 nucleoside diphosphate kinase regulator [Bauldia sp.]